jgi:hypothetical protein
MACAQTGSNRPFAAGNPEKKGGQRQTHGESFQPEAARFLGTAGFGKCHIGAHPFNVIATRKTCNLFRFVTITENKTHLLSIV